MNSIINSHVIDPKNIGDLLSAPANYFSFPEFKLEQADIRELNPETLEGKHLIIGGGGLLFPRFLNHLTHLVGTKRRGKIIAWGIGQQIYGDFNPNQLQDFDYSSYLDGFDLVGIRDFGLPYHWVPCASCMHPSFDKEREIKHEFVVFSHKKFCLKIGGFPSMTNDAQSFDEVLDFLGSGETILTSSYHGAYWGTLLGRKVLAFPFSSKFYTSKHKTGIYPVQKWRQSTFRLSLFKKLIYEFRYKNKFSCKTDDWQSLLKECQTYPDSLAENRLCNQNYYTQILQLLTA
jgi:hypothetical protein